ncbi:MAG: bacterial transcriptional activator domain-containing protein, partial [Cohnella sp.]|nr:bacterial transcriptional activator domain-containing protein [Cohnella sp.]
VWCEPYRQLYREYSLLLGKRLLSYYEKSAAEPYKALRLADLLIEHDPYAESLREAALKLHHRTGGSSRAIAYYESYAEFIRAELGSLPGETLTALLRTLTH